ncbi:MAG: aquaporin [Candidatus Nitrotoga sp.]
MAHPPHKKFLAEALGTFCIVFTGTGAIVLNDMGGAVPHMGVALIFGLAVFAMIFALGDISGAHFNPAVTIGLYLARRISGKTIVPYILSQITGALVASIFLHLLFPAHETLGSTIPTGSLAQSWILESMLTAGLVYVILTVTASDHKNRITAAIAIGGAVALAALFAGSISGASMNPARSLGPAVVSGNVEVLWLYVTAPIFGAAIAVLICACSKESGCCSRKYTGGNL